MGGVPEPLPFHHLFSMSRSSQSMARSNHGACGITRISWLTCSTFSLSIAFGLDSSPGEAQNKRQFDWATAHRWDVVLKIADVRWHGVTVDRIYYHIIDNQYACPVGASQGEDSPKTVSQYKMAVADAINTAHGVANERSYYFNATGYIIR